MREVGATMLAALLAGTAIAAPPAIGDGLASIEVGGQRFRDANRDGKLQPYEDWRLSPAARADDLVRRMTLAEKAGTMMHGTLPEAEARYDVEKARELIGSRAITSFITRLNVPPRRFAAENNAVQRLAAATRLGVPVTISTDPRSHFQAVVGAGVPNNGFSQWPDPLGFGAIGDAALVRRFGTIARMEYRAVGLHEALSPQADLATEPRWPRATGTFGSDAKRVAPLVAAYVEGFQGSSGGLTRDGVMAVVKHWAGYGAQPEGYDGHNRYGRFAKLDAASFAEHVAAFRGAFAAKVAGVMPTYPIIEGVTLDGRALEPVGAGFSRQLLTDLLRGREGYRGIILSDWAITNDCTAGCLDPKAPQGRGDIAMPWGVEALSQGARYVKGVQAGLDQFGGVDRPDFLIAAVKARTLDEARIDQSVRRILAPKFAQGLFEQPFVDEAAAERVVGNPGWQREGDAAQRRAMVMLQDRGGLLPLKAGERVYAPGIDPGAIEAAGLEPVAALDVADVAIVRLAAPFETLHPNHFFGSRQHEGRLDYRDGDKAYETLKEVAASGVPVIASVYLDRPAILGNVIDKAAVVIGDFGASDAALLDVVAGKARAEGRLPFELPRSMAAVAAQDPAKPDDSAGPLFPAGFRLR